jgi:Trk K+ transport system NAD-binding subunit
MILYNDWFYDRLAPVLRLFRFRRHVTATLIDDTAQAHTPSVDTIVFGLGRYGRNLVLELQRRGHSVLGVDFNPEMVKFWQQRGLATLYGDLEDAELFHALPLTDARWVISTIPVRDTSLVLLHALQHNEFAGHTAVTAETMQHREFLLAAGADIVLLPFRDAASEAADLLAKFDI